ncbi:Alkylmercury lyase [Candidatus Nitrososphaera evergladensis SR1]|jgi:alkylmercury lyase|uniref:Alkylmercury lyase n=1 Tax=Candidatus Nitrososphaera evergladensis SR1 TaxID=1459636 RepID=A0A075MZR7_9ARCH|nr:alkylmercury lyase MerB [Candidatus Nitrososphaera evergladensis]AIF84719.1 Alkylmercury lyase [Candidatus Nitrososphaera evergladensis SR1]
MAKTNQKKMNGNEVQQAIDKIATDIFESLIPEQEQRRIFGQTLQLLANGCPVPPDEIAIRLQVLTDKVISTLRGFGAEFDKDGNVLGVGLTLVPTPHVYKVDGRKLYTWCAADALLFPVMLNHTAYIESPDPVTGEKIRVGVTPDRVVEIEPKSAVVSWVKNVDATNIRGSGCCHVHFFSSPETASRWIEKHPDKMFYPANDVYQAMKHIILNKYGDMTVRQERICC